MQHRDDQVPRDEFDQVPETSDRHGVHRARMATPKSNGLGLIILAAVLALAVGALSFFVLPLLGTGGPSTRSPEQPARRRNRLGIAVGNGAGKQKRRSGSHHGAERSRPRRSPTEEATDEPTDGGRGG